MVLLLGDSTRRPDVSFPFVLSFGYRTAPAALRGELARQRDDIEIMLSGAGLESFLVLATCNRFEIYGYADGGDMLPGRLLDRLALVMGRDDLVSYSRFFAGHPATRHLFSVAAGLESLMLGEGQILAQIRGAFLHAVSRGWCHGSLSELAQTALRVGKRVRSETGIARGTVSLPGCALQLATRELGSLTDKTVLLVGGGKMGRLAARSLDVTGTGRVIVASRTLQTARDVAALCGGESVSLAELGDALIAADVVISATGSLQPVIRAADVASAARVRPADRVIVDLAVPADIEPAAASVHRVLLYDADDLRQVAEEHLAERRLASGAAAAIVEEEVGEYALERRRAAAAPIIRDLLARAELIRQREVERAVRRVSPDDAETLDRLSRSLLKALLHDPIVRTRSRCEEHPDDLALIRYLFALDDSDAHAETGELSQPRGR